MKAGSPGMKMAQKRQSSRKSVSRRKAAARSGVKVEHLLRSLEGWTPTSAAESWDNVGLLVGDPSTVTRGAVVSIDLTREAIEEASLRGFSLIFNHHPCIFPRGKGPSAVVAGSLVYEAARRGIAVVATHTNFDRCALEVVEQVSRSLGVSPLGRLVEDPSEELLKLVVFVPATHAVSVREALAQAGAGHIGNYDSCAFEGEGHGYFRGRDGTRPFLGKPGTLERAVEVRLETVFPKVLKPEVLAALRQAHPYEEIAYDLIEVMQSVSKTGLVRGVGYGFWGDFEKPISWAEFEQRMSRTFETDAYWVTEPAPRQIRRIGYVAGKGSSFLGAARAAGCDVFITGEAGYHAALGASRATRSAMTADSGMAVVELGHRESERYFLRVACDWLKGQGLSVVEQNLRTQKIRTISRNSAKG